MNIGPRQEGRDRGSNVVDVGYDRGEIAGAIRAQVEHGRYESRADLRRRHAGRQIAEILAERALSIRKRMTY